MARARREQQTIPGEGFAREKIPEIEEASEDYRVLRDDEIAVGEKAKAAKARLIDAMKRLLNGRTVHVYLDEEGNERRVELTTKDNAKVKKVKSRGDDSPVERTGGGDGAGDVEVH